METGSSPPTPPAAISRRTRHFVAALAGVLVGLIVFFVCRTDAVSLLELRTLDVRFRHRPPAHIKSDLAIVFIGDDSIRGIGRWPWSWDTHALLVDILKRHGARAVLFDVLFAEKPATAGTDFFPQAARSAGNVFFSSYFGSLRSNPTVGLPPLGADLVEPVPSLREAAVGIGHSNVEPDEDGITRRVPLVVLDRGRFYPSSALMMALDRLAVPLDKITIDPGVSLNIPVADGREVVRVPVDRQGRSRVNFSGDLGSFEQFSYLQVLQADQSPGSAPIDLERLRGKTVLVGATFTGNTDVRPTPIAKSYPLLCVLGNMVDNILQRDFIRRPAVLPRLLVVLAIGAVTGLLFSALRPMLSLTAAILAGGGVVAIAFNRFESAGVWIDMVAPLGVIVTNYLVTTTGLYVVHRRDNRRNLEYLKYMKDLVESSNDGIVSIDAAGNIATWNRGAEKMFGPAERRSAATIRADAERRHRKPLARHGTLGRTGLVSSGVSWERLVSPEDRGRVLEALREVSATMQPRTLEIVGTGKDGKGFPVGMNLSTITDSEGRPVGVSCILMDLTEKKRIMEILIQSEKLAEIGRLGSGIVHEIKNPLTSIMMISASALERRSLDLAVAREYFSIIDQEAQRILNLTMDVLSFARPRKPEMKAVDLNRLVEEILSLVEYEVKKKLAVMRKNLAEGGVVAFADAEKLKQVFLNLIINGVHAMERGGELEVSTGYVDGPPKAPEGYASLVLGTPPDTRAAMVSIRDHGSGIEKEILEKIFEPFFSTKPEGQGTGLGLYITRNIVLEHQGSLSVASKPGEGTLFQITLPLPPVEEKA